MKRAAILFTLGLAVLTTGCGPTRIGRILSEPSRFQNRDVTVEGRVTTAFGANIPGLNIPGLYQVEDQSGRIYVLSTRGVPGRDARVRVRGTVTPGVNLGGRALGTAIREKDHRVRW